MRRVAEGLKEIKEVKSALQFPICTKPPQSNCKKMGGELPLYMIEMYQPFTDTTRFSQRRPPIHPIEDDSVWYIDEPEKKYINIHSCVRSGDQDSLSLAFIKNVPVDVTDEFSITPLMTACSSGNYQIAKFLIELGANVKAADQVNQTPLHYACHEGHVDIIRMLVESGATVDSVSTIGETPLMRAIKYCRFSCVEYLIRSGANVMAQNKQEQNCLDIARNYGCGIIIDVISAKYDSLSRIKNNKKVSKPASSKQKKMNVQVTASPVSAAAKQGVKKNLKKKVSKPAFSEQKKVPPPLISAAAKQDLKENIILKNPKFTMRHASKNDISFVPKTRWGKQLTNTSQHI
ncbi:ankyrin repeat and EF-hand domain-containing protein 1 isoform X2 [Triplophysa dalaica]|uniref:ankyrin repeat and EF-hand domain-containing protein 1 isoform X2 n=1 Tax=Triplophysa dalaica TaxID=1582913 RepID=UPI0024DFCCAB|nr:ankyrin repeat and EF-hand domain-containing protein 1 isoform X2 [Triplophysa dalaica]